MASRYILSRMNAMRRISSTASRDQSCAAPDQVNSYTRCCRKPDHVRGAAHDIGSPAPSCVGEWIPVVLAEGQVNIAEVAWCRRAGRLRVPCICHAAGTTRPARRRGVHGEADCLGDGEEPVLRALELRPHQTLSNIGYHNGAFRMSETVWSHITHQWVRPAGLLYLTARAAGGRSLHRAVEQACCRVRHPPRSQYPCLTSCLSHPVTPHRRHPSAGLAEV